ncbi:MAG: alpha/beta hydrolase [Candidatus Thorarchaeota archaeon]
MVPDVKGIKTHAEGATVAFLLIHGFAASTDEVKTLSEFLANLGYASFAVQLEGHGTTPEEFKATTWGDWLDSAKRGLEVVRSWKPKHLFIGGVSMGGLLSLLIAGEEDDISGIVTLGAALKIPGILPKLFPILKYFMKWRDIDLEKAHRVYDVKRFKYDREPVSAYGELFALQKLVWNNLQKVTIPALILQGLEDKTVDPASSQIIFDGISSESKELHMIEDAEHVITCHPTRAVAYPLIQSFTEKIID